MNQIKTTIALPIGPQLQAFLSYLQARPSLSFLNPDIILESMSSFLGGTGFDESSALLDWLFNQDGLASNWLVEDAFQDSIGNWHYQSRPLFTPEEESSLKTLIRGTYYELLTFLKAYPTGKISIIYRDDQKLLLEIFVENKTLIVYCGFEMTAFKETVGNIFIGNQVYNPAWINLIAFQAVASLTNSPFGSDLRTSMATNITLYAMPNLVHITRLLTQEQIQRLLRASVLLSEQIFQRLYLLGCFGEVKDLTQFQNWTFPYQLKSICVDSFYFYY